jgi:hypothetical protein
MSLRMVFSENRFPLFGTMRMSLHMIFSENRFPSPIEVEDMLFGTMR